MNKIIAFWMLIAVCVAVLWLTVRQDPGSSLWTAAFVVPFVVLVSWFLSRYTGTRKRAATIMVDSALAAVVAASFVVWELVRSAGGYWERKSLVEAAIAGAVFGVCSSVSVWSLLRLRKATATSDKLPT